jgi:hypothetical protein
MIESAEIQNFRGFKDVKLGGLSRINVIVGDNGSGKTALLEALFLASGAAADIPNRFRVWRGVDAIVGTGTPQEIYDGVFLDIFHEFNKESTISIDLHGTANESRSVRVFYDQGEPTILPIPEFRQGMPSTIAGYTPITFEWEGADGTSSRLTPRLQPNGLSFGQSTHIVPDATFLGARTGMPTSQNARWFSDMSKWGREKRFISTIQEQFPDIESINVEVESGNAVIFIKFPWMGRKIPVYLASDGLNKLITVLLSIAHSQNTAAFIDEIENGFHASRHERLWAQLLSFAKEYETQLLITTHSWEFLQAGKSLVEKNDREFSFIQVHQTIGVGDVVVIPGRNAADAIEADIEIRK